MKRMVLMILALGLSFSAQTAQADWTPTKRLTWTAGDSGTPAIAADSFGYLHVVWPDRTPGKEEIFYKKSTNAGATWSPNKRLTWTAGESLAPAIAVDSSGNPHVAWHDNTPGNLVIYYKRSTDGGATWTASVRLTWTLDNSTYPAIAVDPFGNPHVVWRYDTIRNVLINYSGSTDGGATWTPRKMLASNSSASLNKGLYPVIAVGPAGTLCVVWHDDETGYYPDQHEVYYTRSTDGGATWSSSQRLSWASGDSQYPAIAADPMGNLHLAFRDSVLGNFEVYYKRSTDEGATWWTTQRLTWTLGDAEYPAVVADSLGNPHVVWYEDTPGNDEIFYRKSTDKGALWSWTAQKRLTWNSGESAHPVIRVDSSGNPHVVWYDNTPGNLEIFCKKSTDGGTAWVPSQRLTWDSEWSWAPSFTVDYQDNIHVVWYKYTGAPQNMDIYYRSWIK